MKKMLLTFSLALFLVSCGRNEPGTMGGEAGTPRTQATGAPAEAAKGSAVSDSDTSAIKSERGSSTFDRAGETNSKSGLLPPDASTRNTPPPNPPNP